MNNNYVKLAVPSARGDHAILDVRRIVFFNDNDPSDRSRALDEVQRFQAAHPHERESDGSVAARRHQVALYRPAGVPLERIPALMGARSQEPRRAVL